ncbi:MAG: CoA transferase [Deltaproteobacteria bacterium CG23_combo_of_CG06-09_8_20_14_all_51_20]|nr:CoA transferase [bacterium]OIP37514.1 MAG: CoA transferase [Desulfobacteraceae bacterium CG2_30_51_40]PIP45687.1 MAG: CoA transferase [Deltaproteobacteria bacterium CG23_combo_of_CG06-09_8_20_14_all_51_20]PIW00886.1 MAG: CoA transferase [Deltaproteobacteria bacterium CG17_big_fil_post_rev_8_21_14_2_50_51_6]PIY25272.1 MAG: CoA transferase [Deltaproteobacteria bacterium CG_4_10_14_3_um_filter_51_14]PJB34509.1 MAG: CoA transferase [Deltaproteobacteria bacterium CG_4_9_14_3_um_filter_51_14]
MEPLKRLTVLSLEQATVLPYLTYRLAHDGMNVIRVEHPVYGDPNRLVGEKVLAEERMNSYFLCINAGKKCITLDLAREEGQNLFKSLLRKLKVDIFATNQLPRNYVKLGIDYESIKAVVPDIIWLGVTGFGPQSNEAAYDPILQARSGLMEMTGEKGGPPQVLGIPLPDMGTSEHAYGLIMKALYVRENTGKGSEINLSMFQSSVSWLTVPITLSATFQKKVTRRGNTHEFFCPVSVFRTQNGFLYLAVGNDRQWKSMVCLAPFSHLNIPQYEKNAGRIADVSALNSKINEVTSAHTTDELVELFKSITLPVGRINPVRDVIADPLVAGSLITSEDSKSGLKLTLAPPPYMTPFLEERGLRLSFPPRFGEHNRDIYEGVMGYSEEAFRLLEEKQVI